MNKKTTEVFSIMAMVGIVFLSGFVFGVKGQKNKERPQHPEPVAELGCSVDTIAPIKVDIPPCTDKSGLICNE